MPVRALDPGCDQVEPPDLQRPVWIDRPPPLHAHLPLLACFGWQLPMRPQGKIVGTCEFTNLCDQQIPQRGGGFSRQDGPSLPWFVDRLVRQFPVALTVTCVDRRIHFGRGINQKVRGIKIVLSGNPDQGEQRIAPGVGQGRAHPVWGGGITDGTDRPVRGDPFAGGMRQQRGQPNLAGFLVDCRGLDGSDLVPTEALADDIEPAASEA